MFFEKSQRFYRIKCNVQQNIEFSETRELPLGRFNYKISIKVNHEILFLTPKEEIAGLWDLLNKRPANDTKKPSIEACQLGFQGKETKRKKGKKRDQVARGLTKSTAIVTVFLDRKNLYI